MASLRLWIAGVAAASFGAGVVVGHSFARPSAERSAPHLDAAADLAQRYELSPEQQRRLQLVLQYENEHEITILRSAQVNQLPPALMNQLLQLRNLTEQRLRALLDADQRARYDRDALRAAAPVPTAAERR